MTGWMAPLPRIAVVAMNALPVVLGQRGRIGGLETFAWNLARGLAASGFETSLVVRSVRKPGVDQVEGVRLLVDVEPLREVRRRVAEQVEFRSGFPWLTIRRWSPELVWQVPVLAAARALGRRSSLTDRLTALFGEFRPDVVVALGVSAESRAATSAAHQRNAVGFLWLQSNGDLDPRWSSDAGFRNSYGVTSADALACLADSNRIIVQTEFQRFLLKEQAGRDAVVVRNPVDLTTYSPGPEESRQGVLWIGRYDRFHKRPLLALQVAKQCPGVPFTLVINDGDAEVADEVRNLKPGNVTIIDSVPRGEMPGRFREARVFLSTGSIEHEGFPNVLLEAAASGTPIVSLEDFDGYVGESHAGLITGGDVDAAAGAVRQLIGDVDQWKRFSHAAREHVERHHSIEAMLQAFRPLLQHKGGGSPADR
jgi:glycosyltransferase involved in cell wall biosynthesis